MKEKEFNLPKFKDVKMFSKWTFETKDKSIIELRVHNNPFYKKAVDIYKINDVNYMKEPLITIFSDSLNNESWTRACSIFNKLYIDSIQKEISIEEKERYELFGEYIIKDNDDNAKCQLLDTYKTYVILNQQDKQIKELEEENNFLEKRNEELMIDRRDICLERNDIFEENQQLKQQLHDLPKKIVEEIRKQIIEDIDVTPDYHDEYDLRLSTRNKCIECLDKILKKHGGKNE